MSQKISLTLLMSLVIYLTIGLAFHFKWESDVSACREARIARGEVVDPEVFGGALGLAFDVAYWPVYAWANIYHFGTPFATPCTHLPGEPASAGEATRVRKHDRIYHCSEWSLAI